MADTALDPRLLQSIETTITELVREAGRIALRYFRLAPEVEFKQKSRSEPVTAADLAVEEYLQLAISREFPEHGILGEEGTQVEVESREFVWVLDPVDGTNNFVNGLPIFGCSAGLLHHGKPVVGAIFLPIAPRTAQATQDSVDGDGADLGSAVVHARLGGGTFIDGVAARASDAPAPDPSRLVGLPGHHSIQFQRRGEIYRNPGEPRSLGSVTYETAMVASGVFGYSVFRRPRIWDVAAGVLLVREAGGQALGWNGAAWEPLLRFEPMASRKEPTDRSLRYWTGTVLVGGDKTARFVADRLRPGASLLARLDYAFASFTEGRGR